MEQFGVIVSSVPYIDRGSGLFHRWYDTKSGCVMNCKRIVYAVEPQWSAILNLVSVDVAHGRVFSKAVSIHYVGGCCHSDGWF